MKQQQTTKRLPFEPLVSLRRLEFLLRRDRSDLKRVAGHAGRYYDPFDILSSDRAKWRHIDNPFGELKTLQSRIYRAILADYTFPANVVGGIPGRSILDNVTPHLSQPVVVAVDIRNCFPSIGNKQVFDAFRESLGFSGVVASLLTRLTTFQRRLPQGAPSSPIIANLVLQPLHRELLAFGLRWTMYIDDITVSGERARSAVMPIVRAVQQAGFSVSHHKIHVMSNGY